MVNKEFLSMSNHNTFNQPIQSIRNAYTILELVFVILIIGILAAVMLPKMSMNRNDAKASTIAQEVAMCINDAGAYYMKESRFDNGITAPACDSTLNNNACFTITPNNNTGVLTVSHNGSSVICTKAHDIAERNGLSSAVGIDHQF